MKRQQVFLTDTLEYMMPYDFEKTELQKYDLQLILGNCKDPSELIEKAQEANILLNFALLLERRTLEALRHLQLIVRYSVGIEGIDLEAATDLGIVVANSPTFCTEEVSDHALALLLACARGLRPLDKGVRNSLWSEWGFVMKYPAIRLRDATVGLIGAGRIGQAMSKKCNALGMRVMAYDPYIQCEKLLKTPISFVDLDTLLMESDFVSLHIPLTVDTYHLLDSDRLHKMKSTSFLINTSRGAVIDESALLQALKEGWIAGAGLDVLSKEPPDAENEIVHLDNVILTPHFSFVSTRSIQALRQEVVDTVVQFQKGEWPRSTVNPNVVPKVPLIHSAPSVNSSLQGGPTIDREVPQNY